MRAAADPFPEAVELRPGRRRSVELALEEGQLVARVPKRMSAVRARSIVAELRGRLWSSLQQKYVFDEVRLGELARGVAATHLDDWILPPWTVRFSKRQRKRWGSCTVEAGEGRIRISDRLRGHPTWVLEHLLLHEMIHLRIFDHGPRFQTRLDRDPLRERARGYLEALETMDMHGPAFAESLRVSWPLDAEEPEAASGSGLPLFESSASG